MSSQELKCNYCDKSYSTKYTKNRHEEKCKYIIEIEKLKQLINIYKETINNLEKENIELKNIKNTKIEYNYVNEYFIEEKQFNETDTFDFNSFSSGFNTPVEIINENQEKQNNKTLNEFIDIYIYHIKNFSQIQIKEKNRENRLYLYKIQKLKQINKK